MYQTVPSLFLHQTFHTQESQPYGSFANWQGVVLKWTEPSLKEYVPVMLQNYGKGNARCLRRWTLVLVQP